MHSVLTGRLLLYPSVASSIFPMNDKIRNESLGDCMKIFFKPGWEYYALHSINTHHFHCGILKAKAENPRSYFISE